MKPEESIRTDTTFQRLGMKTLNKLEKQKEIARKALKKLPQVGIARKALQEMDRIK